MVLNGDILAHLDYKKILKQHKERNDTATIALHPVKDPSRYGSVEMTKQKKIKRFIEKPSANSDSPNLVNAGIYVLNPEIFDYIPKDKKYPSKEKSSQNWQKRENLTVTYLTIYGRI